MFGVSFPEILIVLCVLLIVLGPERLPAAAKTFGKWTATFRKSTESVRKDFYNAIYSPAEEIRREFQRETRELRSVKNSLKLDLPGELKKVEQEISELGEKPDSERDKQD